MHHFNRDCSRLSECEMTPTMHSLAEAIAKRLLQPLDVEEDTCKERHPCRLCSQSFESISDFRQHVQGLHSTVYADDIERVFVEYRKKVLNFVRCAGLQAGWVVNVHV